MTAHAGSKAPANAGSAWRVAAEDRLPRPGGESVKRIVPGDGTGAWGSVHRPVSRCARPCRWLRARRDVSFSRTDRMRGVCENQRGLPTAQPVRCQPGRPGWRTGAWGSIRNPARQRAKTAGALVQGVLFGFCRDDAQDLATAVPAREAVSFYPAGSLSKGRVKQRGLPAARSTAAARPMIGTALRTGAWGSVGSCACSTGMARPAGTRSGGPLPSLRQVGGANACESHRPGRPLDGRKPLAVQVHGVVSAICFCGDPWPPAHWCKGFCQQLVRRYVRGPSQEDHFLLCGR